MHPKTWKKNPKVHHFRSANISRVLNDLKTHWSSIVENNIKIPVDVILTGGEDDPVEYNKSDSLSLKEISANYDEVENLEELSNFMSVTIITKDGSNPNFSHEESIFLKIFPSLYIKKSGPIL